MFVPEQLNVTMLGGFSIRRGDVIVDEQSNRMRKVWLLLAYLIYTRNMRNTQDHYLAVIQGADQSEVDDPAGRLKALLYRVRTMLGQLYENAGHELIIRKNGTYAWNSEQPILLDVEEFDRLCIAAATCTEEAEKLSLYQQALELYKGDFLPKQSMEPWVMPINAYFHQLYMDTAGACLDVLQKQGAWQEMADICTRALKIEPYSENLYQHLMRSRLGLGDKTGAAAAYEEMSELLFDTFGVMPSEESRKLYREATRNTHDHIPAGDVREHLQEVEEAVGAVYCEYDFFRFLYQIQARAIERSGEVIHIGLLSLHGQNRQALPRRSLDRAMDNLQELLLTSLRRGDVISRCSVSQMIVMLPQANYENSCAVCQRVVKAFNRKYPHSPADIHVSVHPLEPKEVNRFFG